MHFHLLEAGGQLCLLTLNRQCYTDSTADCSIKTRPRLRPHDPHHPPTRHLSLLARASYVALLVVCAGCFGGGDGGFGDVGVSVEGAAADGFWGE